MANRAPNVNVGHPPFFEGSNFDYWKTRMMIYLQAMGGIIWTTVEDGYVVDDPAQPSNTESDCILANAQAMNVLFSSLSIDEYNRVCKLKSAHEVWNKLIETYEGTSTVKDAKLFIYKGKFEKFTMLPNEDIRGMFSRLNNIVNELKGLGVDVGNMDISHKFLRALPSRYDTIVTLLVKTDLKKTSPSEILGEILTHDMFKEDQEESQNEAKIDKKKIIAFKAKVSKKSSDDESEGSTDEDVALIVKRFKKFMKKKKGFGCGQYKSGGSSSKNPFAKKKCYECGEIGHISTNCKNKDEEESSPKRKKFDSKKKFSRNLQRRRVEELIVLNGIQMQAPILMMIAMMKKMTSPSKGDLPA